MVDSTNNIFKMKLKKILDLDSIQAYQITKPTHKFKLAHPYKYMCYLINPVTGAPNISEFNYFPNNFAYTRIYGYIFTYVDKLPNFIMNDHPFDNAINVYPAGLDQMFAVNENIHNDMTDIILMITPKDKEVAPIFVNKYMLRCNTKVLVSNDKIAKIDRDPITKDIDTSVVDLNVKKSGVHKDNLSSDTHRRAMNADMNASTDADTTLQPSISTLLGSHIKPKSILKKSTSTNTTQSTCLSKDQMQSAKHVKFITTLNPEHINLTKSTTMASDTDAYMKRKQCVSNISKNIISYIETICRESAPSSVEEWVDCIMSILPVNSNNLPIRYPKLISDSSFTPSAIKSYSINKDNLYIEYDFHAKSYKSENQFITMLEDAFEDMNRDIVVYNTYNNILPKIMKALDAAKIKYVKLNAYSIRTKLKSLREISIKYKLTDFF